MQNVSFLLAAALLAVFPFRQGVCSEVEKSQPPGVVITHSPASTGRYIGSPSLAVLPDGTYVACHDFFGPGSGEFVEGITRVFASRDRGQTWEFLSEIHGAFWSVLFTHRGALYLLGVDHHPGSALPKELVQVLRKADLVKRNINRIVIRKSLDGGRTWTEPVDENSGVLATGNYGFAPTPVIEHGGRLWRSLNTGMLSADAGSDLLKADSWRMATGIKSDPHWFDGQFEGWGEGGAVVAPDGRMVNIVKVRYLKPGDDHAALIFLDEKGGKASFDPATGFVKMPGARIKFSVRFDPVSKRYWALTNYLPPADYGEKSDLRRNTVALVSSGDLRDWKVNCILLHDPDTQFHGMQYLEWDIEGDDLIAVCRTAWPDGEGGPVRQHDANYLTFHRIHNFRNLTLKDSAPEARRLISGLAE